MAPRAHSPPAQVGWPRPGCDHEVAAVFHRHSRFRETRVSGFHAFGPRSSPHRRLQAFRVSRLPDHPVSCFRVFPIALFRVSLITWYPGFALSCHLCFRFSVFPGFLITWFHVFPVAWFRVSLIAWSPGFVFSCYLCFGFSVFPVCP